MSLIWGIPYLLIRVAIRQFPPPTLVFARTLPAALILLPLAVRRNQLRPLIPCWRWIVAFAAVELAIPWLLLTRAEQHLTSSTAGLLVASVPLLGAVVYRLSPHTDRLDLRRSIGLLIGFAGVAVLVGFDIGHSNHLAIGEMGIVALGYTLGPLIVSRRLSDVPSLGVIGVAMALTALCYAPFALTRLPPSRRRRGGPLRGGAVAHLHGSGLCALLCPHRRGRTGPVDGHHVFQSGHCHFAGGGGAR